MTNPALNRRTFHRTAAALGTAATLTRAGSLAPPTFAQSARSPLGINVSGMHDWATELPFADIFKQSRAWFSGTAAQWEDTRPLDLDARGWVRSLQPGQWAKTVMLVHPGFRGHIPAGRYTVTYEGEGTLAYTPGIRVVETSPGRQVLDLDANTAPPLGLYITATNPANYLRNISVRLPNTADGAIFYQPFLESISRYKAIRFLNWITGQTARWSHATWAERPRLEDARWTVRGVPIEMITMLANKLGADCWFVVNHLADDDYNHRAAELLRDTLNPASKVYLEWSDEVWNANYPVARYSQEQGLALGLSTDSLQAAIRFQARRSKQIFQIWSQVFPADRLVRVLSGQAGNQWVLQTAISFEDTRAYTDALSIAPYFMVRPPNLVQVAGMTTDQLFTYLQNVALPEARQMTTWHLDLARRYSLPLIAYEGGQHLVTGGPYAGNAAMEQLFDDVNRDPRMGAIYSTYLNDWSTMTGGALLMHLGSCAAIDHGGNARFGSIEYLGQPRSTAPKYDALMRWIEGA
jgi:hypothetical protein